MSGDDDRSIAAELAQHRWLLGLIAKRLRQRPNGVGVVTLPVGYVTQLRELTDTAAVVTPTHPTPASPAAGPGTYLVTCGAERCEHNDVWDADRRGTPCPACGNTEGNIHDLVTDLMTETTDEGPDLEELFGPVIHVYTRAQAIADGQLIDVSTVGAEAGFVFPVAITAAAWNLTVHWRAEEETALQDEAGRLWDVLHMASRACKHAVGQSVVAYTLAVVPRGGQEPQAMGLKLIAGPGDQGEPVVTIMLPEES